MASRWARRSQRGTLWCTCLALHVVFASVASFGVAFVAVRGAPSAPGMRKASFADESTAPSGDVFGHGENPAVLAHHGGLDVERSTGLGAHKTSIGIGLLATCAAMAAVRRQKASSKRQRGRTELRAVQEETTVVVGEKKEETEDEKEQFRALCTTLMREVGKVQDNLADYGDGQVEKAEFNGFLKKIDIVCDDADAERLFKMLDEDGNGSISLYEMKTNLRKSGVVTEMYNEGIQNSLYALVPAIVLAIGFGVVQGPSSGFDFIAGYVVEDSLSVDNLFVFLVIFKYFKVPPNLQKTCLDLGIYGAVILRAVFIYLGLAAVQSFKPVLLIFAGILLYASYTALFSGDGEDEDEDEAPPEAITALVNALPTTDDFVEDKLFVKSDDGRWLVTPLALCILSIELSDILFAVDSVPAVFAVTEDPLIVFTSNIAAILGLRSLYQILSIAVQDLIYLEKSAAVILGFVGFKLVAEVAGFEIGSAASLFVIIAVLAAGIIASVLADEEKELKAKKKNTIEKIFALASKLFK